jgi:hypothetical protein
MAGTIVVLTRAFRRPSAATVPPARGHPETVTNSNVQIGEVEHAERDVHPADADQVQAPADGVTVPLLRRVTRLEPVHET